MIRHLQKRLFSLVSRGVITLTNSANKCQSLQIKMSGGELKDNIEHIEPYGFTSRPLVGAETVSLFLNGDKSHGVVIVAGDRRYRLKGLEPGEVAIYTDEGDTITFKRQNTIEISTHKFIVNAQKSIDLNAPVIQTNGLSFMVNAKEKAVFMTPTLSSTNEISDKAGTMSNMRQIYNGHTHTETSDTTQKPNQQM